MVLKVSQLLELAPRKPPIITYAPRRGWDHATILHIANRQGREYVDGSMCAVTVCNHAARNWDFRTARELPDTGPDSWWELCPRCGTQGDFENVLLEYWAFREDRKKEYDKREREHAAARALANAAKEVELGLFINKHITPDAPVVSSGRLFRIYGLAGSPFQYRLTVEEVHDE